MLPYIASLVLYLEQKRKIKIKRKIKGKRKGKKKKKRKRKREKRKVLSPSLSFRIGGELSIQGNVCSKYTIASISEDDEKEEKGKNPAEVKKRYPLLTQISQ